jgi:hypothetical protein
MSLLNYTTKISADKTVGEIQQCLAKHGASAILSEYDKEGYIISLSFKINVDGNDIGFKLPSDWRPVLEILKEDRKVLRSLETQEQALRVGWRIVFRWVEAQMAIIETKMVRIEQVFLPYAVMKDGKTVSEKMLDNPKFLLGMGEEK